MRSESLKKAQERYEETHVKRITLKLNLSTDADILAEIEDVPSVQGRLKELTRKGIQAERSAENKG